MAVVLWEAEGDEGGRGGDGCSTFPTSSHAVAVHVSAWDAADANDGETAGCWGC